jgi:hypothetical protein
MTRSAYDRWLKFVARPSSESGLTFDAAEAKAIMALPPIERNWRRDKRDINKAAARTRRTAREQKSHVRQN